MSVQAKQLNCNLADVHYFLNLLEERNWIIMTRPIAHLNKHIDHFLRKTHDFCTGSLYILSAG